MRGEKGDRCHGGCVGGEDGNGGVASRGGDGGREDRRQGHVNAALLEGIEHLLHGDPRHYHSGGDVLLCHLLFPDSSFCLHHHFFPLTHHRKMYDGVRHLPTATGQGRRTGRHILRNGIEIELVDVPFPVNFMHDLLVVIIADGSAELVVVHMRLAFSNPPHRGHSLRIQQFELAGPAHP